MSGKGNKPAIRFSDIIEDMSFRVICVPIRVAFHSQNWRMTHSNVNFWGLLDALAHATQSYTQQMEVYVPALTKILEAIAKASPQLRISTETLDGYLRLIDTYGAVVPPLMLAYASAYDQFATPAQVAEVTGTSESLWRNRAAAREIPGAIKAGKQWLLPCGVLQLLYGVTMPHDLFTTTPAQREIARETARDEAQITDEEWREAQRQINAQVNAGEN